MLTDATKSAYYRLQSMHGGPQLLHSSLQGPSLASHQTEATQADIPTPQQPFRSTAADNTRCTGAHLLLHSSPHGHSRGSQQMKDSRFRQPSPHPRHPVCSAAAAATAAGSA